MNDRESKWSKTEKEAYAIVYAVTIFRPYLYGRRLYVITDHRWLMSKSEPSGRLARWALKLQEYQIEIGYRPGKTHQNADCLSRIPTHSIETVPFNVTKEWITAQEKDEFCKNVIEIINGETISVNPVKINLTEGPIIIDKPVEDKMTEGPEFVENPLNYKFT